MKYLFFGLLLVAAATVAFSSCSSFLDSMLDVAFDTSAPRAGESGETGPATAATAPSKEEPSGSGPKATMPMTMMQPYVSAIFTVFFYHGGFTFEANEYKPGEWTRWKATGMEQGEEFEKAFLARMDDDSEWWQVIVRGVEGDSEEIILEALFSKPDGDYREAIRLRALFPGDEEPSEVPVEKDSGMWVMPPASIDEDDFTDAKRGKEKVAVPAGTFNADLVVYQHPRGKAEWWLAPQVPGGIVKYSFTDVDGSSYTGELVDFGKKAATRLQSF